MPDYEIIAEGSVDGSAPSTIVLSGIPADYTHLELTFNSASTRSSGSYNDYIYLQFNGDSTSGNYCRVYSYKADGVGTPTQAAQGFGPSDPQTSIFFGISPTRWVGQSTQLMTYSRFYIPNYSGTTLTKSAIIWNMCAGAYDWPGTGGSNSGTAVQNTVGGWDDTSAITSITLASYEAGFGFAVNSSYILAGIK
tara:strand:+ start:494 stop:1075 length:582 start_codon:yes stop_codon:yes gene_type:complete